MKVTVKLSEWYARGNVDEPDSYYNAALLNEKGQQCCLGFCAIAHGAKDGEIKYQTTPYEIRDCLLSDNWMIDGIRSEFDISDLPELAMALNDASSMDGWNQQPLEVRMGNLITVFLEGGDELEFVP